MGKSFKRSRDDWDENDYIPVEKFRKRQNERAKKQADHESALQPVVEEEKDA